MGIEAYRARQFRDYMESGNFKKDAEIILEILGAKGEEMKKDEIIKAFAKNQDLEYEVANEVCTSALRKLVSTKKIIRVEHGHYVINNSQTV